MTESIKRLWDIFTKDPKTVAAVLSAIGGGVITFSIMLVNHIDDVATLRAKDLLVEKIMSQHAENTRTEFEIEKVRADIELFRSQARDLDNIKAERDYWKAKYERTVEGRRS